MTEAEQIIQKLINACESIIEADTNADALPTKQQDEAVKSAGHVLAEAEIYLALQPQEKPLSDREEYIVESVKKSKVRVWMPVDDTYVEENVPIRLFLRALTEIPTKEYTG